MVGFCHLTDSHHYHHGQKPTMVGICHGGNMPVGHDDGVDDDDDCAVSDQHDGDDVESHQDSQGRGGPVLQGPEEEVPLLQGSMALDPEEKKNHFNIEFDIIPQSCCQFSFKGGFQGNQNQVQPS